MVEIHDPRLSVGAQCRLRSISRSSFYHVLKGETAMNLDFMLLIDRQFPETPFYGVGQMTRHLQNKEHGVSEKHVRWLMRVVSIRQMPGTGKPAKGRKTYPYLP